MALASASPLSLIASASAFALSVIDCASALAVLTALCASKFCFSSLNTSASAKFFSVCFILPLAYPAYIFGYTYVGFFEFRGLLSQILNDTSIKLDILNMSGAIFIFTIAMFPYVFILARVSFSMVSKSVVELISLYKLNPIKAFFTVYLPLSYPAIFAGTILAIMESKNAKTQV